MVSESIYVSKEAYKTLREIQQVQRGCKPLSDEQYERIFNRMASATRKGDLIRLMDGSLGGGNGVYAGKWWSWTVSDMKKLLTENGFTWEQGENIEYFNVSI